VLGLEPIVKVTAVLPAALKIDLICATSNFLVSRRVLGRKFCGVRVASFNAGTFICPWLR
jgi:hypothetical protein